MIRLTSDDATVTAVVLPARHTCGGPIFGRLSAGCPRCDELSAGAAPITWAMRRAHDVTDDLARHFASAAHREQCGPVCTYGDW